MHIRQANEKDFSNIYKLVQEAFKTAKVSDGTEQDFVVELRKRPTYIPELEFVAESQGKLIGHIMFSKQAINIIEGNCSINSTNAINALMVAPLCVEFSQRNCKVGAELMQYGLAKAKKLGYNAAFLMGDIAYYKRFGFKQISHWQLRNTSAVPDEYILAVELTKDCLNNINGEVNLH